MSTYDYQSFDRLAAWFRNEHSVDEIGGAPSKTALADVWHGLAFIDPLADIVHQYAARACTRADIQDIIDARRTCKLCVSIVLSDINICFYRSNHPITAADVTIGAVAGLREMYVKDIDRYTVPLNIVFDTDRDANYALMFSNGICFEKSVRGVDDVLGEFAVTYDVCVNLNAELSHVFVDVKFVNAADAAVYRGLWFTCAGECDNAVSKITISDA